jgi:hypothetical protein
VFVLVITHFKQKVDIQISKDLEESVGRLIKALSNLPEGTEVSHKKNLGHNNHYGSDLNQASSSYKCRTFLPYQDILYKTMMETVLEQTI